MNNRRPAGTAPGNQSGRRGMIALFTDFGLHGPYTGQMKAVLYDLAPGKPVVDLFADAPAGNPKASAYLLAAFAAWFPEPTVFLCVVDPGVGGARPALVVEADGRQYVGPGNGLFELVRRRAQRTRTFEIDGGRSACRRPFTGATSSPLLRLACPRRAATRPTPDDGADRRPDWPDDLAEIVYVDHFGNAMTGLRVIAAAAPGFDGAPASTTIA